MRPKKLIEMGPRQLQQHRNTLFDKRADEFMGHLKFRSIDMIQDAQWIADLQHKAYTEGKKDQRYCTISKLLSTIKHNAKP